jgi:hypothetical protein
MTDADRIASVNAELDRGPWDCLLVLADLAEERGEGELAAGYRWLARERKHPHRRFIREDGTMAWIWIISLSSPLLNPWNGLPRSTWKALGGSGVEYCTVSLAFHAAAVAIGRWLAQGAPSPSGRTSRAAQKMVVDDDTSPTGYGGYSG